MNARDPVGTPVRERVAIDIGSTMVKVARVVEGKGLIEQTHHPRDFDAGIARQVRELLARMGAVGPDADLLVCSSANGGLRVGIVSLTPHFSGSVVRNQVLLAGANPVYVRDLDDATGDTSRVDILVVAGGIDCADCAPMRRRLQGFDPSRYRFGTLVYAGNAHLADEFRARHADAVIIANPLANGLVGRVDSVFETVRRAYLDDLVYKEGVSELGAELARAIRPTPEIVNRGFQRALANRTSLSVLGACVLFDIGGATTDIHYTVEIIRPDSEERPLAATSVARYVFTDLGIVASLDSTVLQLRTHPRLYDFLACVQPRDVLETYRLLREGTYAPSPDLLSYACLFLALDRFIAGKGPGLPRADFSKITQLVLTGGAAQRLDEAIVGRLADLFAEGAVRPMIVIDRRYQVWVDGITWDGAA